MELLLKKEGLELCAREGNTIDNRKEINRCNPCVRAYSETRLSVCTIIGI